MTAIFQKLFAINQYVYSIEIRTQFGAVQRCEVQAGKRATNPNRRTKLRTLYLSIPSLPQDLDDIIVRDNETEWRFMSRFVDHCITYLMNAGGSGGDNDGDEDTPGSVNAPPKFEALRKILPTYHAYLEFKSSDPGGGDTRLNFMNYCT